MSTCTNQYILTQNQKQFSTYATRTIQLSPQCRACSKSRERYYNSCQLSYRGYINKKYQSLNLPMSTCTNQYILTQNQKQFSTYETHTIQLSPQCRACSKSRERYYNSCHPQKKKKKNGHKIKYFCLFKIFSMFLDF